MRLAEFATAVRESTLKRLVLVPPGSEAWRPTEQALSFADLAQHVGDADEWLFAKLADPQLPGMSAVAGSAGTPDRAAFLALLDRLRLLGTTRSKVIHGLREANLDRLVFDDRFGSMVSVWWVIVRGNLEHEVHHRGQVAAYLRMLGALAG